MAFVRWPVEDFKKVTEQRPQVRAVVAGAVTDEVQEDAFGRKNAGVVGKQAKNQAHKKAFEVVAHVARSEQGVVEPPHQLRGFDIDGVLVFEDAGRAAENETEGVDVFVKIGELELNLFGRVEVVEFKGLKVADENVAGEFGIFDAWEILKRLLLGLCQVAAGAFLLDKKRSLPEQIDEAGCFRACALDRLFEGRNLAALNAEQFEKVVVESLRLALFVAGVFPILRDLGSPVPDLIPQIGKA